jgi:hypothetical protein
LRRPGRHALFAAALLFAAAWPLRAGEDVWSGGGPEGTFIRGLGVDASDGAVVYASTNAGMVRSIDGAVTWSPFARSLPLPIIGFVVDPTAPSTLFVCAGFNRVFRVTAGGTSVTEASGVPGFSAPRILAFDPTPPGTLFAAVNGSIYRAIGPITSWMDSSTGLPGGTVFDIAISPGSPSILYAATDTGVFRSGNGGLSWSNVSTGPMAGALALGVTTLPGLPATVFASRSDGKIFRSVDSGANWSLNLTTVCALDHYAVSPASPSTIYAACGGAGVYRSTNAGDLWTLTTGGPSLSSSNLVIAAAPTSATAVYAGDPSGAYRTSDGGDTWHRANTGLPYMQISAVAVDPVNANVVLAKADATDSLFRSADGGHTWNEISTGSGSGPVVFDPSNHLTVYTGGAGGVWKSVNGGTSWNPTPFPISFAYDVVVDPSTPSTLYSATNVGVYKSVNSGGSWNPASNGLTTTLIWRLAIDPANPQVLYAATIGGGVFTTVDGAATWSPGTFPATNVWAVLVVPGSPSSVLASAPGLGLFRSFDHGATWTQTGAGLATPWIESLAIDPAAPSTIYAGTSDAGVWKSTTSAVNFSPFSPGFPTTPAHALAISASGRFLVAGTVAASVFTYTITSSNFYTVAPCRILDTRNPAGAYGGPALASGVERGFVIAGRCGIPVGARAVAANLTVTQPAAAGYLAAWPAGTNPPGTSALNFGAGQTRAANAIVKLGPGGDAVLRATLLSGSAHVVLDVSGYFGP